VEVEHRGRYVRVVVDGIDLLTTTSSTNTDSGPFLTNFSILEIGDENVLEFSDGIVVSFNQIRKITDAATDVDGSSWIGNLHRLEDCANAFVGLELLWNTLNHESASVEGIRVLGRTEPGAAHADHGIPVDVDESEDDEGDDICHRNMSPEPDPTDISDCEEHEDILGPILGYFDIVVDVDGD